MPPRWARARDHVEQLVAVDLGPGVVDHQHPVAVAVERNAQIRTMLEDRPLRGIDVGRAHALVDVQAVG